jgi:hypothetical protein
MTYGVFAMRALPVTPRWRVNGRATICPHFSGHVLIFKA